jgi:hypothetical protein
MSNSADFVLWILIGIGGVVGGLLYGMRDKELVLPHWEDKHIWNPGFLADILFGLAGGVVIFVIVPGTFDYQQGGWEIVKILALAGVGGYGGRAVVEKLINEQIQELEKNVQQLQRQGRWDAIVIKLVDRQLDDDADTPLVPKEELQEAVSSASSRAKVLVFEKARQFRKECLADGRLRPLLRQVIPVFECLIEDDRENKYHRNHAQLGFVLKDKPNPDWKRAEDELSRAIEIRTGRGERGFLAYEFNRAICRIKLGYELDEILPDLNTSLSGDRTVNWVRFPDPTRAPGLISWLQDNEGYLRDWIVENNIRVPEAERG